MTSFPLASVAFGIAALAGLIVAYMLLRHGIDRPANRSLAAVTFLSGIRFAGMAVNLMAGDSELGARLSAGTALAGSLVAWAGLAFALNWPRPIASSSRLSRSLTFALLVGTGMFYLTQWMFANFSEPPYSATIYVTGTLVMLISVGMQMLPIFILVWRARSEPMGPARSGLFLVAAPFAMAGLYVAWRDVWRTGARFSGLSDYWGYFFAGLGAVVVPMALTALSVVIVFSARQKVVTFLLAGTVIAAILDDVLRVVGLQLGLVDPLHQVRHVLWAASYLVSMLFIAFVVLRGHMPGLVGKVRLGISRSAVAATFIAVIFIASEGAQLVFGDGNEWLGLAAGGALVFALAPLSRFADRVAEKAVPANSRPEPDEELYRHTVRNYLRDERLDPEEEANLAELAQRLGIAPGRAVLIRREEGA